MIHLERRGAFTLAPEMRTWEISRIKGTPAAILARINAPDAETAVKEWIKKLGITDPERQERLVARLMARQVK